MQTDIASEHAHTLELVSFYTNADTSPAEVIRNSKNIDSVLSSQTGYVGRVFAKNENGRWIDVVLWKSTSDAKAAAEAVQTQPELTQKTQPFFKLIDQANQFDFSHSEIIFRDQVRADIKPAVIEIVIFRPLDGVDHEEFMEKARAAFYEVREFQGFIAHQLSKDESGRYIHIISWQSMELAHAAPEKAMKLEAPLEWFKLMDESSVDMDYCEIVYD